MAVPSVRIRGRNQEKVAPGGEYVLYWMTAYRRLEDNYALDRAVEWAVQLRRPLLILEALRCGYEWASDRHHTFVIQGMVENQAAAHAAGVGYYPYVEEVEGAGKGLLRALAQRACVVVTDEFPCFMLPRMVDAGARQSPVLLESVDSNGLLPMEAAGRPFDLAHSFRRFLQKELAGHLSQAPEPTPLEGLNERLPSALPPSEATARWPVALPEELLQRGLQRLPVDHQVEPVPDLVGGPSEADFRLRRFLERRLSRYVEERNLPEASATSELSAYLHFGHISVHKVFRMLAQEEGWTTYNLSDATGGHRAGWWGMSEGAEAFLDQLVTWRELGFNMCWYNSQYDQYASLPPWALTTLREHSHDVRPVLYSLEQLDEAATHDPLWNAAQRQLRQCGLIHNYMRMLWGKKILEWSDTPEVALERMIHLNNKYALDGRDPNSYSGIFWVLGRYDRAWGPERPIFGKIRYMSSDNTGRKLPVESYVNWFRG